MILILLLPSVLVICRTFPPSSTWLASSGRLILASTTVSFSFFLNTHVSSSIAPCGIIPWRELTISCYFWMRKLQFCILLRGFSHLLMQLTFPSISKWADSYFSLQHVAKVLLKVEPVGNCLLYCLFSFCCNSLSLYPLFFFSLGTADTLRIIRKSYFLFQNICKTKRSTKSLPSLLTHYGLFFFLSSAFLT